MSDVATLLDARQETLHEEPKIRRTVKTSKKYSTSPSIYLLSNGDAEYEIRVLKDHTSLLEYLDKVYKEEDWPPLDNLEGTRAVVRVLPPADSRIAILFLSEAHCGSRVLCHECVHLALAHLRREQKDLPTMEAGIDEAEETLCYLVGDIFAGLVSLLREKGHIE